MAINVTRRELKYYIGPADYRILKEALSAVMIPDPHNKGEGYFVRSIYFDTPFNNSFEEKLDGIEKRRKYRLRIYDVNSDRVKFEIKHKMNNSIFKESATISKKDALLVLQGEYDSLLTYNDPTLNKIYSTFKKMLYQPVVVVDYKREAFIWPVNNIRITFDTQLTSNTTSFNLYDTKTLTHKVDQPTNFILEVKFNGSIPSWITNIFKSSSFINSAISKYCLSRMET